MKIGRTGSKAALAVLPVALMVFASSGGLQNGLSSITNQVTKSFRQPVKDPVSVATKQKIVQGVGLDKTPLYFIENQGQMNAQVSHYLQGASTSVYFSPQGLTYALTERSTEESLKRSAGTPPKEDVAAARARQNELVDNYSLKVDFVNANHVAPTALDRTPATVNYFKGTKDQWKTEVPTSNGIKYSNLWPGIDLVYKGTEEKLKYEFHVAPGADPSRIKLSYRGAEGLNINEEGQLEVKTPKGTLTDDRPYSYQDKDGQRVKVPSAYSTPSAPGETSYGFSLGSYDKSKPLVIDPAVLVYAGYIGGSGGGNDTAGLGNSVTADAAGNAYITGTTDSTEANFPDLVGPDLTFAGGPTDAFVAKLNSSGTLLYAGYIGGTNRETGQAVAADASGAAYVTGRVDSTVAQGFPAIVGPDLTHNGFTDLFVVKVSPTGLGLVYAGYLGGSNGEDLGSTVAVDSLGAAYVGVLSDSSAGLATLVGPGYLSNPPPSTGGIIAKVLPDGSAYAYCSWIGSGPKGVAVDSTGAAYFSIGSSAVAGFETVGPDLTSNGQSDVGVLKAKPDGTGFAYGGYIGGAAADFAGGIAVDAAGAAYVTGNTTSSHSTFPDKGVLDNRHNGGTDAFIAKIKPGGAGLEYAGYIGGSGTDAGVGVAVDSTGAAYVVGNTDSTQATFPVRDGPDLTFNGGNDAFIAKVTPLGNALVYAGYVGGSSSVEDVRGIGLDSAGNAYLGGSTSSDEFTFPVTSPCVSPCGPDQDYNGGTQDAWIAKVGSTVPPVRKPPADFDGNNTTDASVYRNGTWYVKDQLQTSWGGDATDKAVPGYYNAGPTADVAVYRGSTGVWYVNTQFETQWGGDPSDIPVPADYNADGITDLAVYRKATGTWYVKDQFSVAFGGDPSDIPVPADYDGDGDADLAVWRKATGTWYVKDIAQVQWGGDSTDVPVPGNYNGDAAVEIAVYRRSTGVWFINDFANISWGGHTSDIPVPGDYNGDGKTELAVYRKDLGSWHVKDQPEFSWGGDPADKPLPLPSSARD